MDLSEFWNLNFLYYRTWYITHATLQNKGSTLDVKCKRTFLDEYVYTHNIPVFVGVQFDNLLCFPILPSECQVLCFVNLKIRVR